MVKKLFGLGKGLGSLIPEAVGDAVNAKREHIFYVEVAKIQPNPDQPRRDFDQEALKELSRSIRKFGVLQPLLVSKIEEDLPRGRVVKYQLIAGERRWRAAQLAGLPQVPVVIRDDLVATSADKSKSLEVAMIENIQRQDLNAIEMAEAYTRLADEFGLTQQDIADKVGKSREAIANSMRLLNLPKYIKDSVREGAITGTMARALLSFQGNADKQKEAYDQAMTGKFSTKDMEQTASSARIATGRRKIVAHNARYEKLMKQLGDHLEAPVIIKVAGGLGKSGQIVIRWMDEQELEFVVQKILPKTT